MITCSNPINLSAADICLVQGDSFIATVTVLYTDGTVPDLDGWGAQAQIRIGAANWFPVFAEFDITWEPPNILYLELDKEVSSQLYYEHFVWGLELITPDGGARFTVLQGRVNVTLRVTGPDAEPYQLGREAILWRTLWPSYQLGREVFIRRQWPDRVDREFIIRSKYGQYIYTIQIPAFRYL